VRARASPERAGDDTLAGDPGMDDNPRVRILNVDDWTPNLYVRRRLLEVAGYEVMNATTGSEALRFAAWFKPALLLIDVQLPDMSGLDVARTLKMSTWSAHIRVVCISAAFPKATAGAWAEPYSRADAYLTEPCSPQELLNTVRTVLDA
jgi:two-component system, sensor histidine kinase